MIFHTCMNQGGKHGDSKRPLHIDTLIVLGDEKWGIAVTKSDVLQRYAADVFAKIAGDEKDEDK